MQNVKIVAIHEMFAIPAHTHLNLKKKLQATKFFGFNISSFLS